MKSYVQLCLVVSNQALAQSGASFKHANTDNDKYAMRCWLLKMGLIVDSAVRANGLIPLQQLNCGGPENHDEDAEYFLPVNCLFRRLEYPEMID